MAKSKRGRTPKQVAELIGEFIRHATAWLEWWKLSQVGAPDDRRELICRFMAELGRGDELPRPDFDQIVGHPGDAGLLLPEPWLESAAEEEWFCEHGPDLAEVLARAGVDPGGVLHILGCAERSGGGPARAAARWLSIKEELRAAALRVAEPTPQLLIDVDCGTATLNGERFDIPSKAALRWLRILAHNPGQWFSSKDLEAHDCELVDVRTDRLRSYLPEEIGRLVDSQTGRGSRLRLA